MKSYKIIQDLKKNGFACFELNTLMAWQEVLKTVSELLEKTPMYFDGSANCYGANFVSQGEGNYRSATDSALGLHQEGYSDDERPRYICFYCVESGQTDGGHTLIADARKAITLLKPLQSAAIFKTQISFKVGASNSKWGKWFNLIEPDSEGNPVLRFAEPEPGFREVKLQNDNSPVLLEKLTKALRQVTIDHSWIPGKTLVIDNMRCLHGRTSLTPNTNRRLLRLAFD